MRQRLGCPTRRRHLALAAVALAGASGTPAPVKDIDPGAAGSFRAGPRDVGGTLFFAANDGATGVELWRSDGTVLVRRPGAGYG